MIRQNEDFDRLRREGIEKISALADRYIWLVTGLIALTFVGISFKDVPFDRAISNANPQYTQDLILSVYVLCWAFGTRRDVSTQKSVYLVDPFGGRIRSGSLASVGVLAAISVILLLIRRNEPYFAITLAVFTSIDVLTWLYLRYRFLPPIIEATRNKYARDTDCFGMIKLNFVQKQVIGNWKWRRQIFLYGIVVCMVLAALFPAVKQGIAIGLEKLALLLSFSVNTNTASSLTQDFLLLLFVAVSEVWHWLYRLRTYWTVRVVSDLETEYRIEKK